MNLKLLVAAMASGVFGTSLTWATGGAPNPWDEKPATAAATKSRRPAAAAPASAPASAADNAARSNVKAARESSGQAATASPFGAPVPAKAEPAIKWGEPIALKPSAAASAPTAKVAAAPASSPVVAAAALRTAAAPAVASIATDNSWKLVRGIALHTQLQKWAATAGWQLEWKLNRSWIVPADVRLTGTFDQAVEQVIQALANEGKPVNLVIWEGNHVAEVNETAPR